MNENSLAVFEEYKIRLNKEGSETVIKCNRLKMIAEDEKMRITDVADLARSLDRAREYWQEMRHRFVERHGG
ncbi:MAG: hypothetical protein KKG76_11905 [Euryarchaeota archaeon]|nr:hypothetical protein [Euryarchaeota archaeon]